ncbi:hypothetical protein RclHR1_02480027 [Rhizophagus clarus]|uniref:Uncharacterized protein n=1 Tax=Rhizophagus clarus TaxID=94130 RepID=A0A2Z6RT64_9GLOM|nr:hypothetical protein RclHR1_02480027 [Rhizophagus clarus]
MAIGTRPEMDIPNEKLISQPEIVKYFKNQLNYHIYGNKGNEKTTLAKKVANEVGKEVIDFTFDEDGSFLF